ncbi:YraN family protein [bacterium]|nr:YraN family protein [bacterium]
MIDKQKLAREGEEAAAEYLRGLDWHIIEKNFHYGKAGEIDIIARDGEWTVFVEVKSRRSVSYGPPEYSITPSKQRQLMRIARGWMYLQGAGELLCRFDVIIVEYSIGGERRIKHYRNAFTSMT